MIEEALKIVTEEKRQALLEIKILPDQGGKGHLLSKTHNQKQHKNYVI